MRDQSLHPSFWREVLDLGVPAWNQVRSTTNRVPTLAGKDLSALFLNGIDLSLCDLTGCVFHGTHLERADLTGAILNQADLTGARLFGARLDHAYTGETTRGPHTVASPFLTVTSPFVLLAYLAASRHLCVEVSSRSFCVAPCAALEDFTRHVQGAWEDSPKGLAPLLFGVAAMLASKWAP